MNELHATDLLTRREPGVALAQHDELGIELEPGLTVYPKVAAEGDRLVVELITAALAD